jgi:hypothetical protein
MSRMNYYVLAYLQQDDGTMKQVNVGEHELVEAAAVMLKRWMRNALVKVGDYGAVYAENGVRLRTFTIEIAEIAHK